MWFSLRNRGFLSTYRAQLVLVLSFLTLSSVCSAQNQGERTNPIAVHFHSGLPAINHRNLGMMVDPALEEVLIETDIDSELVFTIGTDGFFIRPDSKVYFWLSNYGVEQITVESGAILAMAHKKQHRNWLAFGSERTQVELKEGILFFEILKRKDYLSVVDGEARLISGDHMVFEAISSDLFFKARTVYRNADNSTKVRSTSRQRHSDQEIGILLSAMGHEKWTRRLTNEQGRSRRKLF